MVVSGSVPSRRLAAVLINNTNKSKGMVLLFLQNGTQ